MVTPATQEEARKLALSMKLLPSSLHLSAPCLLPKKATGHPASTATTPILAWPLACGRQYWWGGGGHGIVVPCAVTPLQDCNPVVEGQRNRCHRLSLLQCLPTALFNYVLTATMSCTCLPCQQPSQNSSRHFLHSRTVMAMSASPRSKGVWLSLTSVFSVLSLSWHICQRLGEAFAAVFFLLSLCLYPLPLKQKTTSNVLKKKDFCRAL